MSLEELILETIENIMGYVIPCAIEQIDNNLKDVKYVLKSSEPFHFFYDLKSKTLYIDDDNHYLYNLIAGTAYSYFYTYSKYRHDKSITHELMREEFVRWLFHMVANDKRVTFALDEHIENSVTEIDLEDGTFNYVSDEDPLAEQFLNAPEFFESNAINEHIYLSAKRMFFLAYNYGKHYYGFPLEKENIKNFIRKVFPNMYDINKVYGIRVQQSKDYFFALILSDRSKFIIEPFFTSIVFDYRTKDHALKHADALFLDFYIFGKSLEGLPDLFDEPIKLNKRKKQLYRKYNSYKSKAWKHKLRKEEAFPGDFLTKYTIDEIKRISEIYDFYSKEILKNEFYDDFLIYGKSFRDEDLQEYKKRKNASKKK